MLHCSNGAFIRYICERGGWPCEQELGMAGLGETVADLARYRRWAAGGLKPDAPGARLATLVETKSFGANPGDLRMLSYAPDGLAPGAPLVVVLHGCTQSAQAYAEGAGWIELADRHGLVLLCPEQKAANNANRCFNWFQPENTARGAGEAASIRQMILQISADHAADPARVFVTGLSAGGAMTVVMLAAYPDVFAGGAVMAGLPYGAANSVQEAFGAMFQGRSRSPRAWGDLVRQASPHQGRWPKIAIWHGDADSTVRPGAAEEIAKQWTDVWGLDAKPDSATQSRGIRRSVWKTADGVAAIQLNILAGMGHGAPIAAGGPDGCGRAGPYLLESGISSSVEVLRFWGLEAEAQLRAELEVQPRAQTAPRPAQPQPRPAAAAKPHAQPHKVAHLPLGPEKLVSGMEQVITKALTAAGLMK
jgi:feruloyl esterase